MGNLESQSELHRFKVFLNQHPLLIENVRRNGKSWQSIYEQWVLLGESDSYWAQFKKEDMTESDAEKSKNENKHSKIDFSKDTVKQILNYTESMDMDKLQLQIQQLSDTISTIQEVLGQFQSPKNKQKTDHPFHWFRD